MTIDPALFDLEDRGYGRGMGHVVMPSGQLLAVSHEADALELNNVLLRLVYGEHVA